MVRALRVLLLLLALIAGPPVARAAEPVDLLLVFAADVSRSIDHAKFQLQREGYAAAIADPRVLEAITTGRHRRIAVAARSSSQAPSFRSPAGGPRSRRASRRTRARRPSPCAAPTSCS